MNREIKFRGLRIDGKGWVYGYYFFDSDVLQAFIITDSKNVDVFSDSIGQFTGLKDRNGKEIYEGDLVKVWDNYNAIFTKDSADVVFSHDYVGGWVISHNGHNLNLGTRFNDLIVVGNIHENPELLS